MQINLNHPFTTGDVKKMIASKDDSQRRQLRVTSDGIAFLSDEIGNINIDDLAFRVEIWLIGSRYTGEEAANDPNWVSRVETVLRSNWPNPTEPLIEIL